MKITKLNAKLPMLVAVALAVCVAAEPAVADVSAAHVSSSASAASQPTITFSCRSSAYGALVDVTASEPSPYHPILSIYGPPKSSEIGGQLYGSAWPSDAFDAPVGTKLTAYIGDGGPSGMGGIVLQKTYTVPRC